MHGNVHSSNSRMCGARHNSSNGIEQDGRHDCAIRVERLADRLGAPLQSVCATVHEEGAGCCVASWRRAARS